MKYRIRSLAALTLGAAAAWQAATRQPTAAQPRASASPVPRKVDYGRLPPVPADANLHVKSVAEALRDSTHPERFSVLARPAPFDAAAFQADPAAHLNVVAPGRVFQTAQPGPGVPRLRPLGMTHFSVNQGGSVALRIATAPGAPVTFTSFDVGAFENRLVTITVQANDAGVAEARFTATPGTIDRVHVLAGSPTSAGQARFVIDVRLPDAAAETPAEPAASRP